MKLISILLLFLSAICLGQNLTIDETIQYINSKLKAYPAISRSKTGPYICSTKIIDNTWLYIYTIEQDKNSYIDDNGISKLYTIQKMRISDIDLEKTFKDCDRNSGGIGFYSKDGKKYGILEQKGFSSFNDTYNHIYQQEYINVLFDYGQGEYLCNSFKYLLTKVLNETVHKRDNDPFASDNLDKKNLLENSRYSNKVGESKNQINIIEENYSKWSEAEINKANTAKNVNYLSDEEKEVIKLINLARLDGKKFLENNFPEYIRINNGKYVPINENTSYMISLKRTLMKTKNLPMLVPKSALTDMAKNHATDMGVTGKTGHNSSVGKSFQNRTVKFVGNNAYVGENCSYGFNQAIAIVGQLILDQDVPSLGHRENILNSNYSSCGVGITTHSVYGWNCVIDFSN